MNIPSCVRRLRAGCTGAPECLGQTKGCRQTSSSPSLRDGGSCSLEMGTTGTPQASGWWKKGRSSGRGLAARSLERKVCLASVDSTRGRQAWMARGATVRATRATMHLSEDEASKVRPGG